MLAIVERGGTVNSPDLPSFLKDADERQKARSLRQMRVLLVQITGRGHEPGCRLVRRLRRDIAALEAAVTSGRPAARGRSAGL